MAAAVGLAGLCGCDGQTLPGVTDEAAVAAGQATFNARCAPCHVAAALADSANRVVNDLGTISATMNGIALSDEEVANLKAFLTTP